MQIYEELQARGLIAQTTNEEEIKDQIKKIMAVGDKEEAATPPAE